MISSITHTAFEERKDKRRMISFLECNFACLWRKTWAFATLLITPSGAIKDTKENRVPHHRNHHTTDRSTKVIKCDWIIWSKFDNFSTTCSSSNRSTPLVLTLVHVPVSSTCSTSGSPAAVNPTSTQRLSSQYKDLKRLDVVQCFFALIASFAILASCLLPMASVLPEHFSTKPNHVNTFLDTTDVQGRL